jgi:UDP-N-acetylmuramyl pentapeptide phosphotransferase/UDP-N-acetylglucosamine-1-phosphate transferase
MLDMLSPGYKHLVELLGLVSVITFVGSLIAIPLLIGRLPVNYFIQHRQKVEERHKRHPLVAKIIFVLRNGLGSLFLLAGIAMLVLPGQGIITILIGFSFMDFPKKHKLEETIVRRPGVAKALNWLRRKQKKQPFAF